MTREEARDYIIRHCNPDYPKGKTEWETALNMAIDALSADGDCISRQAAKLKVARVIWEDGDSCYDFQDKCVDCLDDVPSAQPEQRWTPVKMRPMDSEEREYWEDQLGEKIEDEDAVMFDCPMPDDGQEILVSYRKWINMDKCEIDGGLYGLEGNGDWEDVIAWMPSPEPYVERREE